MYHFLVYRFPTLKEINGRDVKPDDSRKVSY